jgi:MFS family permease
MHERSGGGRPDVKPSRERAIDMSERAISYRGLIRLPNVLSLLAVTFLSRLAGRMFVVTIVFHALAAFGSPALAGWLSFAAMAPGLLVSPLAGAFLDRAGAARGIAVDLAVSATLMLVLAAGVWGDWAGPAALVTLAGCYALTSPLSAAGIRVLLPQLVPPHVLDRANALDTALHSVAGVIGPSLAGALVGFEGATSAFVAIAIAYAAGTVCLASVRHQPVPANGSPPPSGAFLSQALEALAYVFRQRLLRGLALGYALNMVTWGILVVAVPVAVAQRFEPGTWESVAGLLWAGAGLAGGIGAVLAGQLMVIGREVTVMTVSMVVTALAVWPLAARFGVAGLGVGLAIVGSLAGPIDVGVLTLRQRRTEPGRLGRVLAVSMSINLSGFPIGTALGGMLVTWSPDVAFAAAALASALAAVTTYSLVPAEDETSSG